MALCVLGLGLLLAGGDGQAGVPRIDPSGERIFLPPADRTDLEGGLFQQLENVALYLNPRDVVAPIGTEVILVATVVGPDHYTSTNERVEWSISAGSVGEFVQVGKGSWLNWLVFDFTRARKLCTTFAITSTLRRPVRLTRGTPDPGDDLVIQPGQAWVSVSSAMEGTSYVSAYAPSVVPGGQRRQTAKIQWVDAQWTFPAPGIQSAGSRHSLTTTVVGRSDGRPRRGWVVRYEIVDGPPAGFVPDGAKVAEVATNEAGQATVELVQPQPTAGTNRIQIQILRPSAGGGPESGRLALASGMTTCTWSAPQLAVRMIGPSVVSVGSSVQYTVEVSNPGDLLAEGVRLGVQIPEGAAFLASTPPGQLTGPMVQWDLGTLGPGQFQRVDVTLRADRPGVWNISAEAVSPRGLRSRHQTSTTVTPSATSPPTPGSTAPTGAAASSGPSEVPPEVQLRVSGPNQATVGQQVRFDILVINRTSRTISGLVIRDRFGPGLRHEMAPAGVLERSLPDLPPAAQQQFYVVFQVVQSGQLCQVVELYSGGQMIQSQQVCLTAVGGAAGGAGSVGGAQPPPVSAEGSTSQSSPAHASGGSAREGPAGKMPPASASLKLRSWTEPSKATIGQQVLLTTEIHNIGDRPLSQVQVRIRQDPQLAPRQATQGARWTGQEVEWLISSIPPGEYVPLQVQYLCNAAGTKVCAYTYVTSTHAQADAEACLSIEPPGSTSSLGPAELVVTVTDLKDPVPQGDPITYKITVHNQGQKADFQTTVTAILSSDLLAYRIGTSGPAPYDIQGQEIRFRPVEQIRPGETLTYRIIAQTRNPGEAQLTVKVVSQSLRTPKIVSEKTRIHPKTR